MIKVKVRFFALLKDTMKKNEILLTMKKGSKVSNMLKSKELFPLKKFSKSIKIAVNDNYVKNNYKLKDGDEINIFPPLSGGNNTKNHEKGTRDTNG